MSVVHMGISFFVELVFLIWEFSKVMFWTVFYFVFSPTEKYVRNEIVLITGSGRGLGRSLAIEFAKRGAILVLIDIDDTENSKTVELVKTTGLNIKRINAYHCDLKSREEIREVCENIRRDVGDVTMIINNAGIQAFRSFMECKEEEFISTMRVNLFASYWFLREFLPSMLSRNHGHIVSVASSAGLFGFCHMSDNCTSKFALVGLMESLDHELTLAGYDGVVTTLVYPASINTTLYAKSRHLFNYLTKPLPAQYVAKRIMHAILVNQKNVCVPRILYLLAVIKSILPSKAFMLIANFVLQPTRPNLEVALNAF
ncbi:unnamed protein product [Brachionus calyciflorus]|uniref:Short-chain dehydrogenase/reductase 3 n=1 Tax=Brachionus calyciflorus TaxID=104777 RepID=A0A813M3S2_9BILA|nr:unnamed protein product [Brachionus calyciflorus]